MSHVCKCASAAKYVHGILLYRKEISLVGGSGTHNVMTILKGLSSQITAEWIVSGIAG